MAEAEVEGAVDDADSKSYGGNAHTRATPPTSSITPGSRLSGSTSTLFTCGEKSAGGGAGTAGEGGRAKSYVSAEKAGSAEKAVVSEGAAEWARAEKERDSGGRDGGLELPVEEE